MWSFGPMLWLLILPITTIPSFTFSCDQNKNVTDGALALGYQDFDQRPGHGWRKISDQGKYLNAARLIDRYLQKKGLMQWQQVNLHFHAGQLYAFADKKKRALARFRKALFPKEPANSPIRWNAYVQATIAFLERDRNALSRLREEIAKGPKFRGTVPNLNVVDRLIKHFNEPYLVAYDAKATP